MTAKTLKGETDNYKFDSSERIWWICVLTLYTESKILCYRHSYNNVTFL